MSRHIDLNITADSVNIESTSRYPVIDLTISNADKSALFDQLDIADIIQHFGRSELLDEIGEAFAREHFDIEE